MSAKTLISVEEFDRLEENEFRYELDEGELLILTKPRARHSRVERRLTVALDAYLQENPIGEVFGADLLFVLGPNTKRASDVSVLLRPLSDPDQEIQGAPEIVVEILSPSNGNVDMNRKLKQFFSTGCKLAWVIDPLQQTVEVWEAYTGPARTLYVSDSLTTPLLPDFTYEVKKLF